MKQTIIVDGFPEGSGFIDYENFFDWGNLGNVDGSSIYGPYDYQNQCYHKENYIQIKEDTEGNHYREFKQAGDNRWIYMPYSYCGASENQGFDRVYEFDFTMEDEIMHDLHFRDTSDNDRDFFWINSDGSISYSYYDKDTYTWSTIDIPTSTIQLNADQKYRLSFRIIGYPNYGWTDVALYIDGEEIIPPHTTHDSGWTGLKIQNQTDWRNPQTHTVRIDNINVYDYADGSRTRYGMILYPLMKVTLSDAYRYVLDEDSIGWVSDIKIPYDYNPVISTILQKDGGAAHEYTIMNGGMAGLTVRYAVCVDNLNTAERKATNITCTVRAYDASHEDAVESTAEATKTSNYNDTTVYNDGYEVPIN